MGSFLKGTIRFLDVKFIKYVVKTWYNPKLPTKSTTSTWNYAQPINKDDREIDGTLESETKHIENLYEAVQCVKNAKQESMDYFTTNANETFSTAVSHLTPERTEKMAKSLDHNLFEVDKVTMNAYIKFGHFKQTISLGSDLGRAIQSQTFYIVCGAILCMLETAGVDVIICFNDMEEVESIFWNDARFDDELMAAVEEIAKDHKNLPTTILGLFRVVLETYRSGLFFEIVNALFIPRIYDTNHINTVTKITTFITALITIDGFTEIAEIVAYLAKSKDLLKMLENLT